LWNGLKETTILLLLIEENLGVMFVKQEVTMQETAKRQMVDHPMKEDQIVEVVETVEEVDLMKGEEVDLMKGEEVDLTREEEDLMKEVDPKAQRNPEVTKVQSLIGKVNRLQCLS